jgi:hypothetical protein
MKQSNLTTLVAHAFMYGESSASGRKWRAVRRWPSDDPEGRGRELVEVWHHATHMIDVTRDGTVTPVNPGHGSTSDRCGIRKITAGYNGPNGSVGYRELFEEAS